MEMLELFWFDDGHGKTWQAEKGAKINGASIPRPLWSRLGSPYIGEYRRASIVHDVACRQAGKDYGLRLAADRMFFRACLVGECSKFQAMLLYVGVRIGARLGYGTGLRTRDAVKLSLDFDDIRCIEDFQAVAQIVMQPGETEDAEVIEERTEAAFERVAAARLELMPTTGEMRG